MSVVSIDERGRVILPKGIREMGERAVVIPIPKKPASVSEAWLKSKRGGKELGLVGDRRAKADAVARARRRRQL